MNAHAHAAGPACQHAHHDPAALSALMQGRLRRILIIVLGINLALFLGEFFAGRWIGSSALQADSLDALGDAGLYALSLFVIGRSLRWRAGSALLKGAAQGLFGLFVLLDTGLRLFGDAPPAAAPMVAIATVAFAGNLASVLLLRRYRDHDINLKSVWLCSRNDLIGNLGVIACAGLVAISASAWPDRLLGLLLATLFLHTSQGILREAIGQWRQAGDQGPPTPAQMRCE